MEQIRVRLGIPHALPLDCSFGHHEPPRLGGFGLDDGPPVISDIRSHAVVLFADLRGFTTIAELLSPPQVLPLLNEYFTLLTEATLHNGGTVFHMAGDCLMAGWGIPFAEPDASWRAVETGRQMLRRFAGLARDWQDRLGIDTGLGIGINEGDVVAGNVGSQAFMSYTIIGDTVNVASRLCQRARAGEMVLSNAVKRSLERLGHAVDALELPAMTLRGRVSPLDLWCVPAEQRVQVTPAP